MVKRTPQSRTVRLNEQNVQRKRPILRIVIIQGYISKLILDLELYHLVNAAFRGNDEEGSP